MGTIVSSRNQHEPPLTTENGISHDQDGYFSKIITKKTSKNSRKTGSKWKHQRPKLTPDDQENGLLYRGPDNTTALIPIHENPVENNIAEATDVGCMIPMFVKPKRVRLKLRTFVKKPSRAQRSSARGEHSRKGKFPMDKENKISALYEKLDVESGPNTSSTEQYSSRTASSQSKSCSIKINPLFESSSQIRFTKIQSAARGSDIVAVQPYTQSSPIPRVNKYTCVRNHQHFTYYTSMGEGRPQFGTPLGNAYSDDSLTFSEISGKRSHMSLDHLSPSEHDYLRKELESLRSTGQTLDEDIGDGLLLKELARRNSDKRGHNRPRSTSTDGRPDFSSVGYESIRSSSPYSSASAYYRHGSTNHSETPDNVLVENRPKLKIKAKVSLENTNMLHEFNEKGRRETYTDLSSEDELEMEERRGEPLSVGGAEGDIVSIASSDRLIGQGGDRNMTKAGKSAGIGKKKNNNKNKVGSVKGNLPKSVRKSEASSPSGEELNEMTDEALENALKADHNDMDDESATKTLSSSSSNKRENQKGKISSSERSKYNQDLNGTQNNTQNETQGDVHGKLYVGEKKPPHGMEKKQSKNNKDRGTPQLLRRESSSGSADLFLVQNSANDSMTETESRSWRNVRQSETDTSDSESVHHRRRGYFSKRRPADARSETSSHLRPTSATTIASDVSDHTTLYDVVVSSFTQVIITNIKKFTELRVKRMLWVLRRERSRAVTSMYGDLNQLSHDLTQKFTETFFEDEAAEEDYAYDDRDTDYVQQLDKEFIARVNDLQENDDVTSYNVRRLVHAYQRRLDYQRTRRIRKVVYEREAKKINDDKIGIQEETAQLLDELEEVSKKTKEIRETERAHFNTKLLEKIAKKGKGKNKKSSKR